MQGPTKKRWEELCKQAAIEKDSQKLLELVEEITRLVDEQQKRLSAQESQRATAAD